MGSVPVKVNVYDLGDFNGYISWMGVGVFHSGVEVHGKEYAFGAHAYECSGIFCTDPRDAPGEVRFKCQLDLGTTSYNQQQLEELIARMGTKYQGARYHLLQTNCNHFCSELCQALTGKRPPAWINRLAECVVNVHCLFPPSWLPPLKPPTMDPANPLHDEAITPETHGRAALYEATSPTSDQRVPLVAAAQAVRPDTSSSGEWMAVQGEALASRAQTDGTKGGTGGAASRAQDGDDAGADTPAQ